MLQNYPNCQRFSIRLSDRECVRQFGFFIPEEQVMPMRIARDTSNLKSFKLAPEASGSERREHRRYELGGEMLEVN